MPSALVSNRFDTFTHATTSSKNTAPRIASSAGRTPVVIESWIDSTINPRSSVAHAGRGNSSAGAPPIDSISRSACAGETPATRRPTMRW